MPEVIVKGELHSSRGDHAQEREILTEGVDHLILEGPENDANYGLFQQWYAFAMIITEYLFFRIFYTDSSVLEDIATAQGADVTKTRETDADILENSHVLMRFFSGSLFLILYFSAAIYGIAEIHIMGASLLILSAMLPVLILRVHESRRASQSRNEIMAEKIAAAAENGGRVVAIVGDDHADDVCDLLPEWIEPQRIQKAYPWYSWRHFKDIVYPLFIFISVLWVFYTVFVAISRFAFRIS